MTQKLLTEEQIDQDRSYEGPFLGTIFGVTQPLYRVVIDGHRFNYQKHPEDHFSEEVSRYQEMLSDLNARRITPRSVIGTGYKGNTRKIAEAWINERLEDARRKLAETKAKRIKRFTI